MTKPERIFNCDSGWSIDLDMVTYIGIPEITNTKVTLKIGMDSNVSKGNKDLFIVHEEDFVHMIGEVHSSYKKYLFEVVYEKDFGEAKISDKKYSDSLDRMMRHLVDRSPANTQLKVKIDINVDHIIEQYIEAEFKIFHTELKTAFNKWKNYKEAIEEARNSLIAIRVKP